MPITSHSAALPQRTHARLRFLAMLLFIGWAAFGSPGGAAAGVNAAKGAASHAKTPAGVAAKSAPDAPAAGLTDDEEHWPPGSIGRLMGDDISVEGGGFSVPVPGATSLFVSSGSVVTVHSGAARLALAGGGFVDICGPAKLTVLESNGAYTVALNFGKVRVRLTDSKESVRIYTPFIIATPVAISTSPRDFTLGLAANDSMCVYVFEGAGRLEQQFGGDPLLVPMAGEFFLRSEKLNPVAGGKGSCRCTAYEDRTAVRRPSANPNSNPPPATAAANVPVNPPAPAVMAAVIPVAAAPPANTIPAASLRPPVAPARNAEVIIAPDLAPSTPPASSAADVEIPNPTFLVENSKPAVTTHPVTTAPPPAPDINGIPIQLAVVPPSDVPPNIDPPPARPEAAAETNPPPPAAEAYVFSPDANHGSPVAAQNNEPVASAEPPPIAQPGVIIYVPALAFSSNMPQPPTEMTPALAEQLNESRVSPDWVFKGHVESAAARSASGSARNLRSTAPGTTSAAALPAATSPASASANKTKKPHGVWRRLRGFFGGRPAPPPEPGSSGAAQQ